MRQDNSLFLSTNERQAISKSISQQCRIDGRNLTDVRRIRCRFASSESGCVTARLGATLVVAKVTHDVVEPWAHRPAEGLLQVNLEVPSTDGSQQQQLDDDGLRAQRALERCFKESRCLDLESLCIVPGERVFLIRVTATVVNNDGNVIDCAAMAVVLALADYRRPDVSLVQGAVRVGENAPVPLNLNFYPLVQTFGLFDSDGKYIVADLSAKEETLAQSRIVVAMSANREICCLHTIGGLQLDRRSLINCVRLAGRRARCLASLLDRALASRRLDTLDLLPALLTTADVPMADNAADEELLDDGELESSLSRSPSGSDMDIAQSMPNSPLAPGAGQQQQEKKVSGNPYSMAVVSGASASTVNQSSNNMGSEAVASDTAKHVEFGLRFIRNAMLQRSAASAASAAASTSSAGIDSAASSAMETDFIDSQGLPSVAAYDVYRDSDDEEEVTMVTHLI